MDVTDPQFWIAVFQIIAIDIALGADNAVVIALACRNLPENKRNQGIFWGTAGDTNPAGLFCTSAVGIALFENYRWFVVVVDRR